MAKKMKRKTLVALLIVSTVVAVGGVLGLVEGTSGGVSKIFEDENVAAYSYEYDHVLAAELTDDSTLTQKLDLSTAENTPFKKAVYNLNLYGDEDAGIVIDESGDNMFFKNVSKLEIKLTLNDDVDFYVSTMSIQPSYCDNTLAYSDGFEEGLNVKMRIGLREFVTYDNQSYINCMSQNAYSGDIVITITNDKAKEKEDSIFRLGSILFNFQEENTYADSLTQ